QQQPVDMELTSTSLNVAQALLGIIDTTSTRRDEQCASASPSAMDSVARPAETESEEADMEMTAVMQHSIRASSPPPTATECKAEEDKKEEDKKEEEEEEEEADMELTQVNPIVLSMAT